MFVLRKKNPFDLHTYLGVSILKEDIGLSREYIINIVIAGGIVRELKQIK